MIRKLIWNYCNKRYLKRVKKCGVRVGEGTVILNSKLDLDFAFLIEIGNNCTLTGTRILAHDASTKRNLGYTKAGHVIIGNNCFVGQQSLILPNVRIGDNCIIGAGCVVSKNIPSNSIAVGNPCKIIRNYDDYIELHKKNMSIRNCYDKFPFELTSEEKKMIFESDDISYTK